MEESEGDGRAVKSDRRFAATPSGTSLYRGKESMLPGDRDEITAPYRLAQYFYARE